jgi:GNAT superfamily N-acetyltransferase
MMNGERRLVLRRATHNDVVQLGRWNLALDREESEREGLNQAQLEARMREWIASAQCIVHIAELDKQAVGYVNWGSHGPREVYVRQFYIAPAVRRQGIGRAVVAAMRETAWPKGARVSLRVLMGSTAYLAFWRACGFTDFALTLEQLP